MAGSDKMSTYAPHMAKNLSMETMDVSSAKWITLKKIQYLDPQGKQRVWESAERQTRPANSETDAVGVVAVLRDPGGRKETPDSESTPASDSDTGPRLLLQKQFRPALGKVTIESPSGLVDEGETPAEAAIRELREETGYVGTIPDDTTAAAEGFVMWNDPGFCNTNTKMIFVDVDLSDPRNRDPKPELEEGEFIESFTLPLDRLWEELNRLDREGYAIDARVGGLAQGMEMARQWRDALGKEGDGSKGG
ncbi:ADP-ribose pyrophosphatase [Cladophialophora yegresii CBS 114405]|uniref:ADP-ribose pyrophosphatase n=1 Tax=Cladophialophora yegresii CBS 114405 TaxID=1182544 RepID=W9WEW7_9EURO|nr:ADP-ribose pyrophosphatase [Cladophialophora yegresii CBS 114405]EXJ63121.1 ADP-ribose pyrophosphatase [Cladophialophora yegresii CBS 114405]